MAIIEDAPRAVVLTADEERDMIQVELDELGLTYEQLAAAAVDDEFPSERARRAWFMISPLD